MSQVDYVMPLEHKEMLRDWGFGQVWTHTRTMGDNYAEDREKWYSLGDLSKQKIA